MNEKAVTLRVGDYVAFGEFCYRVAVDISVVPGSHPVFVLEGDARDADALFALNRERRRIHEARAKTLNTEASQPVDLSAWPINIKPQSLAAK